MRKILAMPHPPLHEASTAVLFAYEPASHHQPEPPSTPSFSHGLWKLAGWGEFQQALARWVPEDQHSFYEFWIHRWQNWNERVPAGMDPVRAFAVSQERSGMSRWQCRQAYQAVKLWRSVQDSRASSWFQASLCPGEAPERDGLRNQEPEKTEILTAPSTPQVRSQGDSAKATHAAAPVPSAPIPDAPPGTITPPTSQGRAAGSRLGASNRHDGEDEKGTLMDWPQVLTMFKERLIARNYSHRTIETYVDWARRLAASTPTVPRDSIQASVAVQIFLNSLALDRNLSLPSIQQARNALAWFVSKVLGFELVLEDKGHAHHSRRLPHVIAPSQVKALLAACPPPWDLFFGLQYGCGLRLSELLELRVGDLNLRRCMVGIRHAKGDKDRSLPLPTTLLPRAEVHLTERRGLWEKDKELGWARVDLPGALARKLPGADTSWEWQHVFGSYRPLRHPANGELRRWHPLDDVARRALQDAARRAGIDVRVHPHLLRHCYATHLLEAGTPIKTIQELLGHARLETTMVYMHVRSQGPLTRSPLDFLPNVPHT